MEPLCVVASHCAVLFQLWSQVGLVGLAVTCLVSEYLSSNCPRSGCGRVGHPLLVGDGEVHLPDTP